MNTIKFKAEIFRNGDMDAHYICFPFNVKELFGTGGRVPVLAKFEGVPYTGSLAPMGKELGHVLILIKSIRNKIGKKEGDFITVEIEPDKSERKVVLPPDFKKALGKNKFAEEAFNKLSYTHKKEYVNSIIEAKKPETRERRILKAIEMLTELRRQKEKKKRNDSC